MQVMLRTHRSREDSRIVNQEEDRLLATPETEHQVQRALFLDIVVRERAAILQLLTGEDEALLVWGNALLVLNLALHVVDGV